MGRVLGLNAPVKHYCRDCGRVAVSKSNVCVPKAISQAKVIAKTKTKSKAGVKLKTKTAGKKTTTKKKK